MFLLHVLEMERNCQNIEQSLIEINETREPIIFIAKNPLSLKLDLRSCSHALLLNY